MSLAYQSLSKFSASKLNYSSDDTNKYTQRSERVKSQEYLDNIPQLIIKQQQELEDQLNRLKQLENQNQILHRDKANLQVRASHQKSNSS